MNTLPHRPQGNGTLVKKTVYERLHAWSQNDTALAHLVRFAFHLLRHWMCHVIISVIGTVIIALLIGLQTINALFWSACGIYLLLLIGTAICKNYDDSNVTAVWHKYLQEQESTRNKQIQIEKLDNEVKSLTTITSISSKKIYRVAREIKHTGWEKTIKDYRNFYGFQEISFAVCREVFALIESHFGISNHWVTIYQRFERKNGGEYCKMIGYYNLNYQEPSSYQNEYPLKQKRKKKPEYHTYLMQKSESTIAVLPNKQKIEEKFIFHQESNDREQRLQQYIGLAETVCNRGVFFVLQIDTETENGFGNTEEEIREFAEKYLKPYGILLAMHYETDRLFEVCYNDALRKKDELAALKKRDEQKEENGQ